jgi:hypothetical protein
MPGYTSQRRGTVHTLPNQRIVLFYVLFVLIVMFCVLFVCKRVLYYCHRVSTQLQLNISYQYSGTDCPFLHWGLFNKTGVKTQKDLFSAMLLLVLLYLENSPPLANHITFQWCNLTLNPLTWKIWRASNNARRWQMGFNSACKGLSPYQKFYCFSIHMHNIFYLFLS